MKFNHSKNNIMETKYENKKRITVKTIYDRVEFKGEIYAMHGGGNKKIFVGIFTPMKELMKDPFYWIHCFPEWFNAIFYNILSEEYMDYKKKMNLFNRRYTHFSIPELNLDYDIFMVKNNNFLMIEKNFCTKEWKIVKGYPPIDIMKPFEKNKVIEWLKNRNANKTMNNNLN